jgi:hypothetical protein
MYGAENLTIIQMHMDAAGKAGIEAAYGSHDVDALERIVPVLLEDRRILHRIFVRARRAKTISRAGIPGGRISVEETTLRSIRWWSDITPV